MIFFLIKKKLYYSHSDGAFLSMYVTCFPFRMEAKKKEYLKLGFNVLIGALSINFKTFSNNNF